MKEINDDELQFVVRHYEEGALDTDRAWKRFRQHTGGSARESGGVRRLSLPMRRLSLPMRRIAASVSIALIVGGSIACGLWYVRQQTATEATETTATTVATSYRYLQPRAESIVLKYDSAPIGDVLSELSSYYHCELTLQAPSTSGESCPSQEELAIDRCISGEIEATSLEEVIEILEATLDVEIEIK